MTNITLNEYIKEKNQFIFLNKLCLRFCRKIFLILSWGNVKIKVLFNHFINNYKRED